MHPERPEQIEWEEDDYEEKEDGDDADVIDMEYDPNVCTKQKDCTCKWQFVVDTHIFLPFEEEDVKMVIQQTGASHDQATSSLRDAGGDLVDAMLLLESSNMLI